MIGADKLWGTRPRRPPGRGSRSGSSTTGSTRPIRSSEPNGFSYPPGFPKGQTAVHDAEGDRRSARSRRRADLRVRRRAVRPARTVVPRDPRRRDRRRRPRHARTARCCSRASRRRPTSATTRRSRSPRRASASTATRPRSPPAIEAAVADGMNVINLSLGEPEIDPARDLVVHAIDGPRAAGVVPVIAAGNDFEHYGFGSISSPGERPRRDHRRGDDDDRPDRRLLLGRPDPGLAAAEARRERARRRDHLVAARESGQPLGELSGHEHGDPAVAGAVALLKEQPSDLDGARRSSRRSSRPATRCTARTGIEVPTTREGGGMIDLPTRQRPAALRRADLDHVPGQRRHRTRSHLTDAGGGAGPWTVAIQAAGPANRRDSHGARDRHGPGPLSVTASSRQRRQRRRRHRASSSSPAAPSRRIPFWIEVDHPLLGTEPAIALTQHGHLHGATRSTGDAKVSHYRYPTGGDVSYPRARGRLSGEGQRSRSRTSASRCCPGTRVPHVVYRRRREPSRRATRAARRHQPVLRATSDSGAARSPAAILPAPGTYDDRLRHPLTRGRRGRSRSGSGSNDTTPPALRLVSAHDGTIIVSITDAGSGVDPSSIIVDARRRRRAADAVQRRSAHAARLRGPHLLAVTASDYQETKNMEDVEPHRAEHLARSNASSR